MYVKKGNVDQLLASTSEKFNNESVFRFVDKGYMDVFQMILDDIASKHQYQEGEELTKSDLARIQRVVKYTIMGMNDIMAEQPLTMDQITKAFAEDLALNEGIINFDGLDDKDKNNFMKEALKYMDSLSESSRKKEVTEYDKGGRLPKSERLSYDPFSAMMAVNDYMYAKVMKALGCPSIPEYFGTDVKNTMVNSAFRAEWDIRELDYLNTSVDRAFKKQRRINANKLVKSLSGKKDKINQKNATPLDVAQYAGEYFALKKRQENHSDLWRKFHKKENEQRMQLLAEMEQTLKSVIGAHGSLTDEKMTPIKISEIYGREIFPSKITKMYENSIVERNQMPADSVGYDSISTDKSKESNEPEFDGILRESMMIDRSLFKDCDPIVDGEAEQVSAPQNEQKLIDMEDLIKHNPLSKL